MSKTLNSVTLLGNVGTLRANTVGAEGTKVINFSLATNRPPYKDRTGEKHEHPPEWHQCTAWDKAAELIEQYVKTGDRLLVTGRLQYERYTPREKTDEQIRAFIHVEEFVFLEDAERSTQGNRASSSSTRKRAAR